MSPVTSIVPIQTRVRMATLHAVRSSAHRRQSAKAMRLVGTNAFRLWWVMAIAYHAINGMFTLALALIHIYLSKRSESENAWLVRIDLTILAVAGWSLLLVAMVHGGILGVHLVQSVKAGTLTLTGKPSTHDSHSPSSIAPAHTVQPTSSTVYRILTVPVRFIQRTFGVHGIFGIHGRYFYAGFYVRQVLEIMLQTYQAFQLSRLVPRRWINRFVVAIIVVNCIYVPCISWLLRRHIDSRRITLLTVDVALDFVLTAVVPLVVLIPYGLLIDPSTRQYPESYLMDDVWVATLQVEVEQLLVTSPLDLLVTLLPCVIGLITFDTVKQLIQRAARGKKPHGTEQQQADLLQPQLPAPRSRTRFVFYLFCLVWTLFVCGCDGYAKRNAILISSLPSCSLRVNSWFATNATCAVINVNCHREGFSGSSDEIASVLSRIERQAVTRLILSHCPAIYVPSIISEFVNLRSFATFNSTIVDWPHSAALTMTHTPHVGQVSLIATNLTTFPLGLVHHNLPVFLGLLVFRSNLTAVPDEFHDEWASQTWPYFRLEHAAIASLPPSLANIQCHELSLVGNPLSIVAGGKLRAHNFISLRLSSTDLTVLPELVGDVDQLRLVLGETSRIASVPQWVWTWRQERIRRGESVYVSLRGSPACDDPLNAALCGGVESEITGEYRYDLLLPHRAL